MNFYGTPLSIGGNKTSIKTNPYGQDDYMGILANSLAGTEPTTSYVKMPNATAPTATAPESVPTQKSAELPKSKWETAAFGIGDAVDSLNKGKWAMEEENNRRHNQGVANTLNLLQMIPGIYESRNNARKATYGLSGMAGV